MKADFRYYRLDVLSSATRGDECQYNNIIIPYKHLHICISFNNTLRVNLRLVRFSNKT